MCLVIKESRGFLGIFNKRTCVAVIRVDQISDFMKSVKYSNDKYYIVRG